MEPKSKHKIHVCLIRTFAHSLKVILDNIFSNFMHETKLFGVEFSTCVKSMLKKVCILYFGLGMLNLC